MDETIKKIRVAEIKFLRGLSYFYLVQQFGDIPMPLNDITEVVTTAQRLPEAQVYDQLIRVLEEAVPVLPPVLAEIGRASCREGVCRSVSHVVVAVALTKYTFVLKIIKH